MNTNRITQAIIDTGCSPLALESGASLAEHWIEHYAADEDEIVAVECGFSIRLDEMTWAIGVMDMIARDAEGVFGDEHKSTKEPGRYWTEDKWLESIKTGPQIGLYALALHEGIFYKQTINARQEGDSKLVDSVTVSSFGLNVNTPIRMRVRAAVKSAIPKFWPVDPKDGWQKYDIKALETIGGGFTSKAAQIRAARKLGRLPYQLTGRQCNEFNRKCTYWEECVAGVFPATEIGFDSGDPAARLALPFLGPDARHPDAVILSASAYGDWSSCMEKGRRNAQSTNKEENMALETGTVMHSALACYYEQRREEQLAVK